MLFMQNTPLSNNTPRAWKSKLLTDKGRNIQRLRGKVGKNVGESFESMRLANSRRLGFGQTLRRRLRGRAGAADGERRSRKTGDGVGSRGEPRGPLSQIKAAVSEREATTGNVSSSASLCVFIRLLVCSGPSNNACF